MTRKIISSVWLALIVCVVLSCSGAAHHHSTLAQWRDIDLSASGYAIRADHGPNSNARIDALIYRGGLDLKSGAAVFGGFSALHVSADGERLTALSDRGRLVRMGLTYWGDNRLQGAVNARMISLLNARGDQPPRHRDSEGLIIEESAAGANGVIDYIISFERRPRLDRYREHSDGRVRFAQEIASLDGFAHLRSNKSLESVARLDEETLLTVAQSFEGDRDADYPAFLVRESGVAGFEIERSSAHDITDVTRHGDTLFVLQRHFDEEEGTRIRIARAAVNDVIRAAERGEPAVLEVLAHLGTQYRLDNFEGISVRTDKEGRTFLYLISDDNFSARQKTLLLMFELAQ